MEKLLICSGDSFTDPHYRSISHPEIDTSWPKWPEVLAKKLDMRLINLGRSGSGNEYIYSSIQDTIESIEDKSQIGLVIAGWSQCFRIDFEKDRKWQDLRINSNGDLFGWVKKSLRIYKNFEYMCEYHNIPYVQTQMIPFYIDWIRGLALTEEEINERGLNIEEAISARPQYTGDAKGDNTKVLEILNKYDSVINKNNFIGWPISRQLGGYCLSPKIVGFAPESPYTISKYDGHPSEEGQKRLAEAIYTHILFRNI